MPTTAINVNKQTVLQLLGSGSKAPFVIPEYQRPYAWTEEQVTTLFEDIWEFMTTNGGSQRDGTYFLGCIVSYENDNGEQEIIDGQQRITTLFLLLRAMYASLENADSQNDMTRNFLSLIGPAIWRKGRLDGKLNHSDILISSRVVNNDGNAILRTILETGEADENATDNYSSNYRLLQKLFKHHAEKEPLSIFDFIYAVLEQSIMLPITADSQNTALIIFNTLNARGLPLSDADIFKAKIYNNLDTKGKCDFIERWKILDEEATNVGESVQSLFYYYMFYLRAKEGDCKSTTPGIRKYYEDKQNARLYDTGLLDGLFSILNLWKVVRTGIPIETEPWSTTVSILQKFDILSSYPNEFWKYPVIIYYLQYRNTENFTIEFELFLQKLLAELTTRYCLSPTLNAVKGDILKLDVEIANSRHPLFAFREIDDKDLVQHIKMPYRNSVRLLLKILAYEKQDGLLPPTWEIEHIFPQHWKEDYVVYVPDEYVKERIEHLGNFLPFEKRLNIIASNMYLGKKKPQYQSSEIAITKAFGDFPQDDWTLDDIISRDAEVTQTIITRLKEWHEQYRHICE